MAIITQSDPLTFFVRDLYSRHGFVSYILKNFPDCERKVDAWCRSEYTCEHCKEALRSYFIDKYKDLEAEFIFSDDDLSVAFPSGMVFRTVTFSFQFTDQTALNKMKLKYPRVFTKR
jgi:hypothetical protein